MWVYEKAQERITWAGDDRPSSFGSYVRAGGLGVTQGMWRPPLLHPRQTGLYENQSSSQVCPKELAKGTTSSPPNTAALDPWLSKEASPQQSPARPGSSAAQTPRPARWRTRTQPRQAPGGPHPRHSEWHLNPSRSWLHPAALA